MFISHRRDAVLTLVGGVTALLSVAGAGAQTPAYPSRPIVNVVPQAAGGGVDTAARVIMQRLSVAMGQPIVVDNKVGAGGVIGTRYVARAPGDGYTLLLTSPSHIIQSLLNKHAGYDAINDFTAIALIGRGPFVLVANPNFEAKTTAQLIALAKQRPGRVDFGSVGVGSFNHLLGEMLNSRAGIKLQHVPYRGSSAAAAAVVSGEIPVSFNSLAASLPFIRAGKLRALGVSTPEVSPLAPDIPPISATVPGYEGTTWYGLLAPAGIPKPVLDEINKHLKKVLEDAEVTKSLASQGIQVKYGNPDEMRGLLVSQTALWSRVIRQAAVPFVE